MRYVYNSSSVWTYYTVFNMFPRSPIEQVRKQPQMLRTKAFHAQYDADIRQYSMFTAEAEAVRKPFHAMEEQRAH